MKKRTTLTFNLKDKDEFFDAMKQFYGQAAVTNGTRGASPLHEVGEVSATGKRPLDPHSK